MAGRGFINEVEPIKNNQLLVLKNGRWREMFVPVNFDRSFLGISLAESFADAYQKDNNVTVGLIPCADGDTSATQWLPGSLLFENAVNNALLASKTSNIVGVIWHQGEADCTKGKYPRYEKKLKIIFDELRNRLNLHKVPFIVGGLGEFYQGEFCAEINKTLSDFANNQPMCAFASSKGLTSNPDNIHFNATSLREFGLRYYEAFKSIQNKDLELIEKPTEMDIAIECEKRIMI